VFISGNFGMTFETFQPVAVSNRINNSLQQKRGQGANADFRKFAPRFRGGINMRKKPFKRAV
jgi:hypothetical protein